MIQRNYPKIKHFLDLKKSLLVLGPRGTGKTYYLGRLINEYPSHEIINMLDSSVYQKYLLDPSLLYKEIKGALSTSDSVKYLMIDEIQRLPVLLNEVHRCIEEFKPRIVFLLTGSSARKLKRENANLLAGRALSMDFLSLSSDEIDFSEKFDRLMLWGNLPEVVNSDDPEVCKQYLTTYVSTYLEEEIKKESDVRNLAGFRRFLDLAAAENGTSVNYSKIGKTAGVSPNTVKDYYSILVDTLVAYEIPAWFYSTRKQLQRSSRFYLFDNGVISALTGHLSTELRSSTYLYGNLFENLVVTELVRQQKRHFPEVNIYNYKTLKGKEIDLILQRGPHSLPVAVEIKSGTSPTVRDVKPLRHFATENRGAICYVLCRADKAYTEDGISFFPFVEGISKVLQDAKNTIPAANENA